MSTTIAAGSQEYLQLLRNIGNSAEFIDDYVDTLWASLDDEWAALREGDDPEPVILQSMATHGMALLSRLTSTAIPDLIGKAAELHIRKNAGYAGIGNSDPWANFRLASDVGVTPYRGVLVRLSDKYIRMRNLRANPANDQVGEALVDTLSDYVAYALIALCLYNEMDGGSI